MTATLYYRLYYRVTLADMYFNSNFFPFEYENEGYANELGMREYIICMKDVHTKIYGKFIKIHKILAKL